MATDTDRRSTILKNLRRRDNIRDFIDGLDDSECWPYPNGETYSIPADNKCLCCDEPIMVGVELRKDKLDELTRLHLINVYRYHPLANLDRGRQDQADLTDLSIELCPEEGSGSYSVSYEAVDKMERAAAPKLNLRDVAVIRSAFIHRHEWVLNKLHSVNDDRLDTCTADPEEGLELHAESDTGAECRSQAPLSEEEDHGFLLCEDVTCDPGDESEEDQDDLDAEPGLVVVQPRASFARGQSSPSVKDDFDVSLGCDQAYGPSAKPHDRTSRGRELPYQGLPSSQFSDAKFPMFSSSRECSEEL